MVLYDERRVHAGDVDEREVARGTAAQWLGNAVSEAGPPERQPSAAAAAYLALLWSRQGRGAAVAETLPQEVAAIRALHKTIGDSAFFRGLRRYIETNRNADRPAGRLRAGDVGGCGTEARLELRPGDRAREVSVGARRAPRLAAGATALLALGGCSGSLPPLRGQMQVGHDAYAIFVGGTGAAGGDLYAVRTDGGPPVQITFTTVGEMRPALSSDGAMVAFLRGTSLRDSTPATLWVMNLLNGGDRELELPKGAGAPAAVGWSGDGRSLVVRAAGGLYRVSAPPARPEARPVPPAERSAAESALAVLVGDPVFARVVPCAEPGALCVAADTGTPGLLARHARGALRWGGDSVAYFVEDRVEIRPVGPGRSRLLGWDNPPSGAREMTVFLGR